MVNIYGKYIVNSDFEASLHPCRVKSHDVYIFMSFSFFFGQIFGGRWDCPKCGPLGM